MLNMKLYVIVVTYNGQKWIDKCLSSVYNSTIHANLIVIDNCSTDDTVQIIRSKYPQAKLIISDKNLGFGKANNKGIRIAINEGAEYVYLLNQDAWVDIDVFENLINIHQANRIYGILSPLQLTGDGKSCDKNFYQAVIKKTISRDILNDALSLNLKDVYETSFVMAAHWLLYVPDLQRIGLFSPIFPHYGEDGNLIQRYQYRNLKIGYCHKLKAYHDREYRKDSPSKIQYQRYINYVRSMNDPTSHRYIYNIIRFFILTLSLRGVSVQSKLATIMKGLRITPKCIRYRSLYKTEKCYHLFE